MTSPRTALGFDYGMVRIGVAVGQELTGSARPLLALPRRARPPDWVAIARLIDEWRPAQLVVGVPRHADGTDNKITGPALAFARELEARFDLPVATVDERLSSREAVERLAAGGRRKQNAPLDPMAAAVILESWFQQQ